MGTHYTAHAIVLVLLLWDPFTLLMLQSLFYSMGTPLHCSCYSPCFTPLRPVYTAHAIVLVYSMGTPLHSSCYSPCFTPLGPLYTAHATVLVLLHGDPFTLLML